MAEKLGSSVHAVWRVLRREGIYLQRVRSWCVSTDKELSKTPRPARIRVREHITKRLSTSIAPSTSRVAPPAR